MEVNQDNNHGKKIALMGENDAKVYYPDIRQAIWLLIRVVLWMILLSIPLGVVDYFVDYPLYKHPAVLAIMNLAAFGLVLKWGIGKQVELGRDLSHFIGSSVVISCNGSPMHRCKHSSFRERQYLRIVLPAPEWVLQSFVELVGGKQSLWGSVLILVIVAPITEEFLFRGLILDGFLRKYSVRKAILVSALLFAAFHLNPWQFVGAFVVGILFAWWRVNTGSILPGILGHALFNAIPMLVLGLKIEITGYSSDPTGPIQLQPWWFDVIGVILFVTAFFALQQRFAECERPNEVDSWHTPIRRGLQSREV